MFQDQGVPLLGKTPKERATINQWIEVESQNFITGAGPIVKEQFIKAEIDRPMNKAIVDEGLAKLQPVLDIYEVQLSKHKYIAGDEYTLADAFNAPNLNSLMSTLKTEVYGKHPHVLAWAENVSSRPAVQKVMELNAKWLKQQTPWYLSVIENDACHMHLLAYMSSSNITWIETCGCALTSRRRWNMQIVGVWDDLEIRFVPVAIFGVQLLGHEQDDQHKWISVSDHNKPWKLTWIPCKKLNFDSFSLCWKISQISLNCGLPIR